MLITEANNHSKAKLINSQIGRRDMPQTWFIEHINNYSQHRAGVIVYDHLANMELHSGMTN